ncbi:MAG: hypothetical protein ACOY0T_30965 [Myxococcota bacterium]
MRIFLRATWPMRHEELTGLINQNPPDPRPPAEPPPPPTRPEPLPVDPPMPDPTPAPTPPEPGWPGVPPATPIDVSLRKPINPRDELGSAAPASPALTSRA